MSLKLSDTTVYRPQIRALLVVQASDKCFIPALFAHADGDDFVLAHHSKHLYERLATDPHTTVDLIFQ